VSPRGSTESAIITHSYNSYWHRYDGVTLASRLRVNWGPAVSIPDDNLRAGLNAALGKPSGDVILRPELAGLTSLNLNNRRITDLTGLEHATGLTELFIARNGFSDISALSGLTSLTESEGQRQHPERSSLRHPDPSAPGPQRDGAD